MLTNERIAEIEARVKRATPGPWAYRSLAIHERAQALGGATHMHKVLEAEVADEDVYTQHCRQIAGLACTRGKVEREEDNGEFIAHARQDVPDLIAEVKRLRLMLPDARQNPCVEEEADAR